MYVCGEGGLYHIPCEVQVYVAIDSTQFSSPLDAIQLNSTRSILLKILFTYMLTYSLLAIDLQAGISTTRNRNMEIDTSLDTYLLTYLLIFDLKQKTCQDRLRSVDRLVGRCLPPHPVGN